MGGTKTLPPFRGYAFQLVCNIQDLFTVVTPGDGKLLFNGVQPVICVQWLEGAGEHSWLGLHKLCQS